MACDLEPMAAGARQYELRKELFENLAVLDGSLGVITGNQTQKKWKELICVTYP
ncbi:hypothetical protein [Ferdinandcohnia sp. SAFN-114]|uniref:hypothetical protein n=1 Tax=Ferdinandcohnia sp. SAFN-114 TaxID=3387275 RepID=UPI003F7DB347